jgi:hypothetical protein
MRRAIEREQARDAQGARAADDRRARRLTVAGPPVAAGWGRPLTSDRDDECLIDARYAFCGCLDAGWEALLRGDRNDAARRQHRNAVELAQEIRVLGRDVRFLRVETSTK